MPTQLPLRLAQLNLFFKDTINSVFIFSVIFPFTIIQIICNADLPNIIAQSDVIRKSLRNTVFNANLLQENILCNGQGAASIRLRMAGRPIWKRLNSLFATTGTTTSFTFPPLSNRSQNRYRSVSNPQTPLCLSIFIIGLLINNDPLSRKAYLRTANINSFVPTIWNEFNKSHRNGTIGEFDFSNKLSVKKWNDFLTAFDLLDTPWDHTWLRNEENMSLLLDELSLIKSLEGNYIKFERASLFQLSSGENVTASSINIQTVDETQFNIKLFNGNSVSAGQLNISIFDAILSGRVISSDDSGANPFTFMVPTNVVYNFNPDSFCQYIIQRCTGVLNTGSSRNSDSTPGRSGTTPSAEKFTNNNGFTIPSVLGNRKRTSLSPHFNRRIEKRNGSFIRAYLLSI